MPIRKPLHRTNRSLDRRVHDVVITRRLAGEALRDVPRENQRCDVTWAVENSFVLEVLPRPQRQSNFSAYRRVGCGGVSGGKHLERGFKSLYALKSFGGDWRETSAGGNQLKRRQSSAVKVSATKRRITSTTTIRTTQ